MLPLWLQEEETGKEQDALDLYQHSLEELLLLLAGKASAPLLPLPLATLCSPLPLSLQQRPQAEGGSSFTLRYFAGLGVRKWSSPPPQVCGTPLDCIWSFPTS